MKYLLFMLVCYTVISILITLIEDTKKSAEIYKDLRKQGRGRIYSFFKAFL